MSNLTVINRISSLIQPAIIEVNRRLHKKYKITPISFSLSTFEYPWITWPEEKEHYDICLITLSLNIFGFPAEIQSLVDIRKFGKRSITYFSRTLRKRAEKYVGQHKNLRLIQK